MQLTKTEQAILADPTANAGKAMALEMVVQAGRILGADRLISISSAHIDGCLYHGASGMLYCEKLVELGAKTAVPSTTNVGALNLLKPKQSRLQGEARKMAYRLMVAHERLGCLPSWTCAPYQAGATPAFGDQVAWGESNAVAFVNTVFGARTNRYGDFLDIACAISGRAPHYGLHVSDIRKATVVLSLGKLPLHWQKLDVFFPTLGAMIGRLVGSSVSAVTGLVEPAHEDALKALCAGAAATGAVGLIHLVGRTPEAPDLQTACGGVLPEEIIEISPQMFRQAYDSLSQTQEEKIDCVALGSPHFSLDECQKVIDLAQSKSFSVPVYICLGRHTFEALEALDLVEVLEEIGVELVVDTCVVTTPILPETSGVMMTNSAKFAHYSLGNTGFLPVFGALGDCVLSAQKGRVVRSSGVWQ